MESLEAAPHIILVHGLGRSKHDMFLLAPRLRELFPKSAIHTFDYRSRHLSITEATLQLCDFVYSRAGDTPASFVGHSLGGIITRALDASGICPTPLHRLVTLGSPHNGAVIAKWLARYSVARSIFGPILHELGELDLPAAPKQLEIGCIVGATHTRFGFLPILGGDNDGLVLTHEAKLANSAAQIELVAFHGLMPFSKRCAQLSAKFLAHGGFAD